MRLVNRRAEARRGFACVLAFALCLGPDMTGVRAQETAAGGQAAITSAGEPVLLREQPGYDAAVLSTLADGNPLKVAGELVTAADGTSWLPVVVGGQSGYVPVGFVAAGPTAAEPVVGPEFVPEPAPVIAAEPPLSVVPVAAPAPAAPLPGTTGATTTEANLRSGPSVDTAILTVLPPGTSLSIDGPAQNGFFPVTGSGTSGWIAAELLSDGAAVAAPPDANFLSSDVPVPVPNTASSSTSPEPAPDATRGESTGIAWPMAGGEWEV